MPNQSASAEPRPPTSLLRLVAAVTRHIWLVAFVGLAGAVIAGAWAMLATPRYRATVKFALEERTMNAGSGGLAALAGQLGAGALAGTRSLSFFADVLTGRDLLEQIALDSFPDPKHSGGQRPLVDILSIKGADQAHRLSDAVDYLGGKAIATATNDRTGTITLDVVLPDPALAAQVADRLYHHLEQFNFGTRHTSANERRRFAERELVRSREELGQAEGTLRALLEANKAGVDNIPRLALQRQQIQRRIDVLTEAYARLARELEDAKVDEVRDTPVFTLVQAPEAPVYRDFPKRVRMVVTGGILGAALAIVFVALRASGWSARRLDPAGYQELRSALGRRA